MAGKKPNLEPQINNRRAQHDYFITHKLECGIALMGSDERVTADTALRIGLVSEITRPEALHARAQEIAAAIARKPSAATQGTVRAIWESLDMGRRIALINGSRYWQVGNPLGTAEIDRAAMPRQKWSPR